MSSGVMFRHLAAEARRAGVQKFVAGGVLVRGEKVLVLRRKPDDFMPGIYELPSGVVEPRETIEEGLRREVLEETALAVEEIVSYLGHFDYTSGSGKKTRQFNFVVRAQSGNVRMTEHDDYAWCKQEDLKKYKITPETLKTIEKYFNGM